MTEPISIDTLVELKDRYSNVYRLSPTGARGWVRAKRQYAKTDPEVYIEWDKKHWRYQGEPDGWTFEHHFRPVDDAIPDDPDMTRTIAQAKEPPPCPDCGQVHPPTENTADAFLNELLGAQEAAISSEGYFILTIAPVTEGGQTIYQPELFSRSLSPAARKIIEGQIMLIASELFQREVYKLIEEGE